MALLRDNAIAHKLGLLLAEHMAAANILGRAQVVQEVHRKAGKAVPIATTSRLHFAEDDPTIGFDLSLPADGAADYLRSLTPVTRHTFDGLTDQYKRIAFTITGVTDQKLIGQIRDDLSETLRKGGTVKDFERAVDSLTDKAGVDKLSANAIDNIFTNQVHKAYAAGRYEQQNDPDVVDALPYMQYLTVGDDHVRPAHADLDGFTALTVDPVWKKIYPPNDWGCRCLTVLLLASEAPDGSDTDGRMRLPALSAAAIPGLNYTRGF